jgi:uncharacterized membrane protein
MLKAYDDYRPGTGAEIMEWIKQQTQHRQSLERTRTTGSESRLNRAQKNSLIVGLLGILVAAVTAIWSGWVAAVIAIVAVGGPSTATVLARILDRLDKRN